MPHSGSPAPKPPTTEIGSAAADRPRASEREGRAAVPAGSVGVPVRLAEPAALALVQPGDRVDLLRIGERGDTTEVARAALILSITGAEDPMTGGLLVALTPDEARRAVSNAGRGFAILLRPD